jgi:prophage DNA circulation protein
MAVRWDWTEPTFLPGIGLIDASGSFRDAWFRLDSYETTVGRRADVRQYAMRNKPNAEDLGRKARSFNFSAYVLGFGWEQQRDALINACEADGPGTLVHPFHGTHRVICEICRVTESRAGGRRYAAFALEFTEAGGYDSPSYAIDTGYVLLDECKSGYGVIEDAF